MAQQIKHKIKGSEGWGNGRMWKGTNAGELVHLTWFGNILLSPVLF